MKLNIKEYTSQIEWVTAVVNDLTSVIKLAINDKGETSMLLSGGGTPGPVYEQLNATDLSFDKMKIGLVDERFVPTNSSDSNELLLKRCFPNKLEVGKNFESMVHDDSDENNNLRLVKKAYQSFAKKTDIIVLGMGGDGHTASIFPWDAQSYDVRSNGISDIFSTTAPTSPKARITCSLELITKAKHIYLLIAGKNKKTVLSDYSMDLPIHNVLERRSDVKIYYLEK